MTLKWLYIFMGITIGFIISTILFGVIIYKSVETTAENLKIEQFNINFNETKFGEVITNTAINRLKSEGVNFTKIQEEEDGT